MSELKPCPFCGGKPDTTRWGKLWDVQCDSDDCFVQPETKLFDTPDEAIEAWNRRAKDAKTD